MSLIQVQDGPSDATWRMYELGEKLAADRTPTPAYCLSGMLYVKEGEMGTWGMLSVPNALVRGVFAAMDEPGIELPPSGSDGKLMAHISVFRPDELEMIGGADRLSERGKRFAYTLGRLVEVEPAGWPEMSKCWFIRVHSPELQTLRRSYGLSSLPNDGKYEFHVTVAVRRRGVTGRNDKSKS